MTQEEFDLLVEKNQPHKVFNSDWSIFYALDFADTLLPDIPLYKGKALWMFDGAELFSGLQKSQSRVLDLDGSGKLISLIGYTFPKGVKAEEKRQFIQVESSEVCTFLEIDQNENIDITFKFGKRFSDFLKTLLEESRTNKRVSELENQTYHTSSNELKKFFNNQLTHEDMMRYIFFVLEIKELYDYQEFDPELFQSTSSVTLADLEPEREDDRFLEKFDTFIKSLNKGNVKNFDCVIQLYRSKEQLDGKAGIDDTGYSGGFGFNRYSKDLDGDGKLSLKYFPNFIIDRINNKYKVPFLSLWTPKSRPHIFTGIRLTTKATIWCKFGLGVDTSFNAGGLYYDTGTPKIKINGRQKGILYKNTGEVPFSFGDETSFEVECVDTLTDYAFIVFRETDVSGKIVGLLNILPNKTIYKTEVNIVEVKFSSQNLLIDGKGSHSLRQPLLKHFNENSFNQSLICVDLAPSYQILQVDRKSLPSVRIDSQNKNYISSDRKDLFNKQIIDNYNSALIKREGNELQIKLEKLNDIIKIQERKLNKNRLLRAGQRLIDAIIKKFEIYKNENDRFAKTFEDQEVIKILSEYRSKRDAFRKKLCEKVLKEVGKNSEYVGYQKVVEDSILNGTDITKSANSGSMPTISTYHKVFLFLYHDIESFKDDPYNTGGIAGFATTGDGYCHIFNLALNNNTQRDELIAHEVGHAFGLEHTFEYTKEKITEKYNDDLEKIEDERKVEKNIYDNNQQNLSKGINPQVLTGYFTRIKEQIKNLSNLRLLDTTIANEVFIKDGIELDRNKQQKEQTPYYEITYINKKQALDEAYKKDLDKILNLGVAQTKENYMDYYIPKRKSFWYWQWKEMQKNIQLLEEIKLDEK